MSPTSIKGGALGYISSIDYLPQTKLLFPLPLPQPLPSPPLIDPVFRLQLFKHIFPSDRFLQHISSKLSTLLPHSNSPPHTYTVGLAARTSPFTLSLDSQ
jgi:hypothetical protein